MAIDRLIEFLVQEAVYFVCLDSPSIEDCSDHNPLVIEC